MTAAYKPTEEWQTIPWKQCQREVFRLQRRIYQAAQRGNFKQVHNLQRLLLRSWSARCQAVRQVSQDNRGKRTPGVDGVARLTARQRCRLTDQLRDLDIQADPIRRIYIPKPNSPTERRPLGIPTMKDRAYQALVKLALEPEWEAQFEPNSYAFRPGRRVHDAIEAVFQSIALLPKYVLETDIEKCFDRIAHEPLIAKMKSVRPVTRLVRQWLKAGVMEQGEWIYPEAGTPQGGVLSPLLANIALHGLENHLTIRGKTRPNGYRGKVAVIRYADDLVVLHPDREMLEECRQQLETWLEPVGLRLKESKTFISHTRFKHENRVGFDFLGFNIRQYEVGKHRKKVFRERQAYKTLIKPSQKAQKHHLKVIKELIRRYRSAPQAALVAKLNPVIRGWRQYYCTSVAAQIFTRIDHQMMRKLLKWAKYRHPKKTGGWAYRRYWQTRQDRQTFGDGKSFLTWHAIAPIRRHTKVKGTKSLYDGDWVYWSQRLGRYPTQPKSVAAAVKRQSGKCVSCGLYLKDNDRLELHHRNGDKQDNRRDNLWLVHGHCHDQLHRNSIHANDPPAEEPDDG